MHEWQVPLAAVRLTDADISAAVDVYRSGWLSMGPRTEEFEDAFGEYARVGHCVAVSSCTAALHIACKGAGLGPGDEAVVPSVTFVATPNAVAYTGARPVFAEIAGLERPWLSVETVERALTDRTKAILPVSYGGHAGEIEALRGLAEDRGIAMIEDAAHGAGSWLGEHHLGTFGLAGAISFSSGKNLGIGEGGVLLTDDGGMAEHARAMRWHGVTASIWDRHRSGSAQYGVSELGFNYRIDDPRSALALSRLGRLEGENRRRGAIDSFYRDQLEGEPGLAIVGPEAQGARASYSVFAIVLDEEVDRDGFRAALTDRGVQTSVHFPPAHRFELYAGGGEELPLTDAYAGRTVSLPIFAEMEDWQRELVVESVRGALRFPSGSSG